MSSSVKPCPGNSLAYLSTDGGGSTLYVCLTEDKGFEKDRLEKAVRDEINRKGLVENTIGFTPGGVYELVQDFLQELKKSVEASIREVYGWRTPVDLSLPKISEDKGVLNPGEFPGSFLIVRNRGSSLILHVEPKIGWEAYFKMLQQTRQSIDLLVAETGVLEPLLGNLYYPSLTSPVSYSILLLRLTELILSSTPPKKTVRVEILSRGVVGKPVLSKTLKHIAQGSPYGVFKKVRVKPQDYPFILLAKFHNQLFNALEEVTSVLHEALSSNSLYRLMSERIEFLQSLHAHYLTTPPLHEAFSILAHQYVQDSELLQETRRASRLNPYLGVLADLYEMFHSDIGLVHEYLDKGHVVPSASSKIYELWVLTRLVEHLKTAYDSTASVVSHEDLYIKLRVQELNLIYNMPLHGFFTEKLREKRLMSGEPVLRPDFILASKSGSMVLDAKYKHRLVLRDVVTMLAYIAEFATPVGGEKMLLGVFYKLGGSGNGGMVSELIARNSSLPVKMAVQVHTLDPRMPYNEAFFVIQESLKPLTRSV